MKKILALVLVLSVVFALAACGSSESPAPTETPAPTEKPAITETPIVTEPPVETTPEAQEPTGETMGNTLKAEFESLVSSGTTDPQAIADALLASSVIEFAGATMPVEPGYLAGFSTEIDGFEQGVMFGPAIGSIPFVGYIFVVDGDTHEFGNKLLENADPRWNICVEADEVIAAGLENLVFFVMCPNQ